MVFMDVDDFHNLGKQCISIGPLYLCGSSDFFWVFVMQLRSEQ